MTPVSQHPGCRAECERLWFRIRFAGEPVRRLYYWSPDQPQSEIDLAAADSAEMDFCLSGATRANPAGVADGP